MKGIIYMRSAVTRNLLSRRFNEFGHEVIFSANVTTIEKEYPHYRPDFTLFHCHTLDEEEDFDRIRSLTRAIREELPECFITVMYHPSVKTGYRQKNLVGYSCDMMLKEDFRSIYEYAERLQRR
jgi:hypothetical protein